MKYFPFENDHFRMTMNAKAMISSLIEVDEAHYISELALKDSILASDYSAYFQCVKSLEHLAWEAIQLVLPKMAEDYPSLFHLDIIDSTFTWENRILGTTTRFCIGDSLSLPLPPLDWLGRQVQEDLILMQENSDGNSICVAGHLCFGSAWSLADKLGKSFLDIHDIVPGFQEQIGASSDQLMRKLKRHRPVCRLNWSIAPTSELNMSPALRGEWLPGEGEITSENAGDRCFLRVERQTMCRLLPSDAMLFTIHTYLTPISEIALDKMKLRRMANVLQSMPPANRTYKGMNSYFESLMEYLENQLAD